MASLNTKNKVSYAIIFFLELTNSASSQETEKCLDSKSSTQNSTKTLKELKFEEKENIRLFKEKKKKEMKLQRLKEKQYKNALVLESKRMKPDECIKVKHFFIALKISYPFCCDEVIISF